MNNSGWSDFGLQFRLQYRSFSIAINHGTSSLLRVYRIIQITITICDELLKIRVTWECNEQVTRSDGLDEHDQFVSYGNHTLEYFDY